MKQAASPRGEREAPSRVVLLGVAGFWLASGAVFVAAWLAYPDFLYYYRDGEYSEWLVRSQRIWSRPGWALTLNPFQGMGSLYLPINPWLTPGAWALFLPVHRTLQHILSYLVYWVEAVLAVLMTGRLLGFGAGYSAVGAVFAACMLFPPLNFSLGLQGWLAIGPFYAHSVLVASVGLSVFSEVGSRSDLRGWRRVARESGLTGAVVVLVLYFLACVPLWNAGMLAGFSIVAVTVLLSSRSSRGRVWKLACLGAVTGTAYMLGVVRFYRVAHELSSRYAFEAVNEGRFQVDWGGVFSGSGLSRAVTGMCAWGLACPPMHSHYLFAVVLLGTAMAGAREKGQRRVFAVVSGAALVGIHALWFTSALLGVRVGALSPLYFILPLYPLWALYAIYPAFTGLSATVTAASRASRSAGWRSYGHTRFPGFSRSPVGLLGGAVFVSLLLLATAGLGVHRTVFSLLHSPSRLVHAALMPKREVLGTPLVDELVAETALRPGAKFRGMVASVFGLPGGPLRAAQGVPAGISRGPWAFESDIQYLWAHYGNYHTLDHLWRFGIPTLEEYGQYVSPVLAVYVTQLLGRPDTWNGHFALVTEPNVDVLRALGVRFVVSDALIQSPRARRRRTLVHSGAAPIHLYELLEPNLATFSPTEVAVRNAASEIIAEIRNDPVRLEHRALTDQAIDGPLVPVTASEMRFIRNGVRVTASSPGRSALLLPLQFSHCLTLEPDSHAGVTLYRANLIHTLVVFSGELDARIRWPSSVWYGAACRGVDAAELRRLNVVRGGS